MTYTTISETVGAYNELIRETASFAMSGESFPGAGKWRALGVEIDPALALDATDPIAYKCGWIDWCDAEGIDTDDLEDDYTFTRDRM